MKKAQLDLSEFMVMCRQQGFFNLNDIQTAVFEYNGKLSILPKSQNRPATPQDLNLSTKEDKISTEIIMDGKVLTENLKHLGLNKAWLEKELRLQGYSDCKQIFLAICDNENSLTLFV